MATKADRFDNESKTKENSKILIASLSFRNRGTGATREAGMLSTRVRSHLIMPTGLDRCNLPFLSFQQGPRIHTWIALKTVALKTLLTAL